MKASVDDRVETVNANYDHSHPQLCEAVDLQLEGKVEWASRIARFAACLPAIRIVFVGLSEPSPLLAPASGCLENRAAIQYTPENPP